MTSFYCMTIVHLMKVLIPDWLNEIENLLAGIEAKGLMVLPLSELIGKPVMISMIGGVEEAR